MSNPTYADALSEAKDQFDAEMEVNNIKINPEDIDEAFQEWLGK